MPSSWALDLLKVVHFVQCCLHCQHTTVQPDIRGTRSLSSQMTQQWWDSFMEMRNQCKGKKKHLEGWCREQPAAQRGHKRRRWFSREHGPSTSPSASGAAVERVENIEFLGVQISQDLRWNNTTSGIVKWAQQRLHFPRNLKQASLPTSILRTFYRGVVESANILHLNMVLQLQYSMSDKKSPAEDSQGSWEGHLSFPPICPRTLPEPLQKQSTEHCQGLLTTSPRVAAIKQTVPEH